MKTKLDWIKERQQAAEWFTQVNNAACAQFAEVLRANDTYKRISREFGTEAPDLIPREYFDAMYRILSFGKLQDRAALMLGTADDIERLVSRVQSARGFYDDSEFWIAL